MFAETVGVEAGPVGHGNDRTIFRAHYNHGAALGILLADAISQRRIGNALNGAVERELNRFTHLRIFQPDTAGQ